jgi:hypothetical protein
MAIMGFSHPSGDSEMYAFFTINVDSGFYLIWIWVI